MKNLMRCINNVDYEDCMTLGKLYEVEIEDMGKAGKMHKFIDDNGDFLQTMLSRFEAIN